MMCEEMILNIGFPQSENYLQEKSICSVNS